MDTDGAGERIKVDKQPLEKALEALDIDTEGLEHDARGLSLVFPDADACRAAHAILNQPDNMHKLAELGWVFSVQGDVAQANEPSQFRIRFLEITDVEPQDEEPKPIKGTAHNTKLSAVIKKGREFATTPMDHDDDMNTVEYDDKTSSNHRKGLSKEKDGAQPEGKPKGSTGSVGEAKKDQPAHLKSEPICKHCKKKLYYGGQISCTHCGKAQGEDRAGESSYARRFSTRQNEAVDKKKKMSGLVKPKEGTISGTPKGSDGGAANPGNDSLAATEVGKTKDGEAAKHAMKEALLDERGNHKSGCACGFCKNKGNIHKRNKPNDDDDGQETETGTDMKSESVEALVDRILDGADPVQEMNPSNPGTPPGITGHKSYPTMKVGSPDRKFRPAKGMVQPDSAIVNQQAKRKVKSV